MSTIGALIDRLYAKDREIKSIEKKLRTLRAERDEIEVETLASFKQGEISGAKGAKATAIVKTTEYPSIANRPKFLKFVIKNKAWDLFQNRIASKAYFDRREDEVEVPGVKLFKRTRISVTKK